MKEAIYPGANRTARYWPTGGGELQTSLDKLVLHSTETSTLPGYSSSSMPNITVNPWPGQQGVWQHLRSVAMSAKALRDNGGFAENRDKVSQIEIIGYSDPAKKGTGKFLPDLPPEGIEFLAEVVAWYAREWGIKLVRPTKWPAYPASYGSKAGARMTTAAFDEYAGLLGHLHVPDSVHGDVTLDIDALLAAAKRKVKPLKLGDRVLSKKAGQDVGPDVKELIALLIKKGVYVGTNDGVFGPMADAGVRTVQQLAGLPVTGVVDAATLAMLQAPQTPPQPDPIPEPEVPPVPVPTPVPTPPVPVPTPKPVLTVDVATFNCQDPRFGGHPDDDSSILGKAKVTVQLLTEAPEVVRNNARKGSDWLVWPRGSEFAQAILFRKSVWKAGNPADVEPVTFGPTSYHGGVIAVLIDIKTNTRVQFGAMHEPPTGAGKKPIATDADRLRYLKKFVSKLDPKLPTIIGGDFNSTKAGTWLKDLGFKVLTTGATTDTGRRIDYLAIRGDIEWEQPGTVLNPGAASDHRLVKGRARAAGSSTK